MRLIVSKFSHFLKNFFVSKFPSVSRNTISNLYLQLSVTLYKPDSVAGGEGNMREEKVKKLIFWLLLFKFGLNLFYSIFRKRNSIISFNVKDQVSLQSHKVNIKFGI